MQEQSKETMVVSQWLWGQWRFKFAGFYLEWFYRGDLHCTSLSSHSTSTSCSACVSNEFLLVFTFRYVAAGPCSSCKANAGSPRSLWFAILPLLHHPFSRGVGLVVAAKRTIDSSMIPALGFAPKPRLLWLEWIGSCFRMTLPLPMIHFLFVISFSRLVLDF